MSNDSNHEDVERRAYELYERRGKESGRDWEDWLQAERDIRGREGSKQGTDSDVVERQVERTTDATSEE